MTDNIKPKKKTTSKVKKKESWTISELQMWFRTAIDLQGDDWYPDEEVWAKIVDMVFRLKPDEPVRAPRPPQGAPPQGVPTHAQPSMGPYDPRQHHRDMSPAERMLIGGHNVQTDGLALIPPSSEPLPEGAHDIELLRRQSENGTLNGKGVIKSAKLNEFA